MRFFEKLTPDSQKCVQFLNNNNKLISENIELSTPFLNFINNFTSQYNHIKQSITIKETDEFITVYKSNKPHILNYLEHKNHNFLNNINMNEDLEIISEKISNSDKDIINNLFNEALQNFEPLQIHQEIYQIFCPIKIQFLIEQTLNFKKIYYSNYNNTRIVLKTFTDNQNIIPKYIRDIICRLLTINFLSNTPKDIMICKMWCINQQKKLPRYKYLSSHCVNTASTYCNNCTDVKIWRIEEAKKVACHEVFHCIGLDFHNIPFTNIERLKNMFNIPNSTEILLFESYVELWATIINCICISNTFDNNHHFLTDLIKYEISYSLFQTAKIINFFKFNKFKDFFNILGFEKKKDIYKQNTCAISYFIIKSALLFSVNNFIHFCYSNNKKSIFKFYESEKTYQIFFNLIIDSLDNEKYKNYIDQYILTLKKLDKNDFIYYNLRMTCLENF